MEKTGKHSRGGVADQEGQHRNAEGARLREQSADRSRYAETERQRNAEYANSKRAELQSYLISDEIERDRRYHRQLLRLKADQQERNGLIKAALREQTQLLEERLSAEGARKIFRDLTGRTQKDETERKSVEQSLQSVLQREAEEEAALQQRQQQERDLQTEARQQRERAFDEKLRLEQQHRDELAAQQDMRGVKRQAASVPPLQEHFREAAAPLQDRQIGQGESQRQAEGRGKSNAVEPCQPREQFRQAAPVTPEAQQGCQSLHNQGLSSESSSYEEERSEDRDYSTEEFDAGRSDDDMDYNM